MKPHTSTELRVKTLRKIFLTLSFLTICSCEHFEQDKEVATTQAKKDAKQVEENVGKSVTRMANNVRDRVKETNERLRDWWLTPLPSKEKKPMPNRYCYKVLQDILCYRSQMTGWENKLVGYQGANAATPTPPTTKALQFRADDPSSLPANRAEQTKPVFATMPTNDDEAKNAASTSGDTVVIDSTHETLPDPALAPQL